MTEVVISKKRIFVGLLIAVLLAGGVWGFSFIRQYLPGQVNAASAPTPGLSSTPGDDQFAQTAAQAGAQAFYTVDYQAGQQAWLDKLCAVSTDIGCAIDQNVLAPNLWTQFDQAKTKTTVQVSVQIKTVNGIATTRSNAPFQVWRLNIQLSESWPMQKPPQTSFQALALVVKDSSAWKFERFLTEEEAKGISQKDLQP